MHPSIRPVLLIAILALLAFPQLPVLAGAPGPFHLATGSDLALARTVSRLAVHSPTKARRWAQRQHVISRVALGKDRITLDLHFRDGAEIVILPPTQQVRRTTPSYVPAIRALRANVSAPPGARAVVLEPFQDELGLPANTGQPIIDALKASGFTVDVFRNGEVTVGLLQHLSDYSVVYMETHSGTLDNGDAIINTASTDAKNYKKYISTAGGDGTVKQALSSGTNTLFLAITGEFVAKHVAPFTDSSFVYLDGCDLFGADTFWHDLQSKNIAAMVTWDNHVYDPSAEIAAQTMFGQLVDKQTLATSLDYTAAAGFAAGLGDQGTAHLKVRGDGSITLEKARTQATPEPTATPTPTDTPTPGPTATDTPSPTDTATPTAPRKRLVKCKKGKHRVHRKCVPIKKPKKK